MNEQARGLPDAFKVATFAFREDIHDAWRSTVTDPGEALAHDVIWGTPDARELCDTTSQLVFHLVEEHIAQKRDVDTFAIYGMMERVYVQYRIWQSANDYRGYGVETSLTTALFSLIQNGTLLGGQTDYEAKPTDYKEKDRRIIVAGFASLADPLYRQLYWDERHDIPEVLRLPGIRAAAADGERVLNSVRAATPYDQSRGFALEVITNNCPTVLE